MKRTVRLNEADLHRIIKESINRVLKETKTINRHKKHLSESTYRGIPNTKFVWHGEWSDPEVIYKGKSINYWDADEHLNSSYQADVEDGYQGSFDQWIKEQDPKYLESCLDELIMDW